MIQVGQTIGNYRITAKLGEGGMGIVYLAEHPVIGKKVAMKAIHPELSRNQEVVSRFMTEARAVNQIGNDHIVDISDFGTTPEGEFYFVMEFLQGESMSDRLKRERIFAPTRALAIAVQIADALGASHEHGIIHRDLKPENVHLITRGTNKDFVKVLDFGLAKLTMGDEKVSHKTRTGSVMGTPYYMAPEQCEGKANIDRCADIYSLGVILFEMLTGKVPFGGEGYGEIIVKHITMPPPSPRTINPSLPESLEKIIFRALAKNREQRFQSMGDFRTALLDPDGWAAGAPAMAMPEDGMGSVTGAMPLSRADVGGSGQVGFGSGIVREGGNIATPMPSTFRQGMGEVVDDVVPRRSNKGLIIAVMVAAVAGGGAAVFVLGKGTPPPSPPPVVGTQHAAHKPPMTVKVNFTSDPTGVTVVRVDTGKELGVTPMSQDLTYADTAVEFVFKKAGYEDKTMSYIPNVTGNLPATLRLAAPTPVPAVAASPSGSSVRKSHGSHKSSSPSSPKRGRTPDDEDGVLEPAFR